VQPLSVDEQAVHLRRHRPEIRDRRAPQQWRDAALDGVSTARAASNTPSRPPTPEYYMEAQSP
jgi:hypothetical protein